MNEKLCVDPAAAPPWILSSIFVCFQWIPFSDGLTKQQRDPRRSHQFPSTQGPSAVPKAQEHTPPHADACVLQPISCVLSLPLSRQSSLVDAPADVCRVCTAILTDIEGCISFLPGESQTRRLTLLWTHVGSCWQQAPRQSFTPIPAA